MSYILFVDDEEDIRDIIEMTLSLYVDPPIITAISGENALEVIAQNGEPLVVISDFRMANGNGEFLYYEIQKINPKIPFIFNSADSLSFIKSSFPNAIGFVEKPNIIKPIVDILSKVLNTETVEEKFYVPINMRYLMKLGDTKVDIFIKLGDKNFKRIVKSGDSITEEDIRHYSSKGIHQLYLTAEGAKTLITGFEKNLSVMSSKTELTNEEKLSISLATIEQISEMGKYLGWDQDCIQAAMASVRSSIDILSQNPDLASIIKRKLQGNQDSKNVTHVGLLSLASCSLAIKLGWYAESTLLKIGMASVLHDLTLDDSVYENSQHWNELARDFKNKDPQVVKYRMHPVDAADLIKGMKNVPPDLDQIVLHHHEMPDGSGFPLRLHSMRIDPMSSLLIITHDLVDMISDGKSLEESLHRFIDDRELIYGKGNFKKVYDVLKDNLRNCPKKVA